MSNQEKNRVIQIILDEMRSNGHVQLKQLTPLLERHGISRAIYKNLGPKRWLISNFSEFKIEGDPGKEVILLADAVKETAAFSCTIEEARLEISSFAGEFNIDLTSLPYCIGVINFCKNKCAYINNGFETDTATGNESSVMFNPTLIRTIPENFVFDTMSNIYLVLYAVSGTVKDEKNGIDHPAIDYSIPIRIIRTIPKKMCTYIKILPDEVMFGLVKKNEKPVLTAEKKEIIFKAIKDRILNSKGAIRPTEIPEMLDSLKEHGINRFIYQSERLQPWLKTNFPDLFVSPSPSGGHEYIYLRNVSPEEIERVGLKASDVDRIRDSLIKYLQEYRSIELADISPKVLMPNGLDIRFYPLGKSFDIWLMEQSQFSFSKDELSITLSESYIATMPFAFPTPIPSIKSVFTDADMEELTRKFDSAQYVEFLSSECFRRLKPCEIPTNYMEKALTAARRLVFGFEEEEVHLNSFQQNLLKTANNDDFSDWNTNARYNDDILKQCLETMIFGTTKSNAAKMLNEVIHKRSLADQYLNSNSKKTKGLVSRFQMVRNEQVFPLYVVAAFAQNDQTDIKTIIVNYCRFIQELNEESGFLSHNRRENCARYLAAVLRTILKAPCAQGISLDSITQTLSVFVDTFSVEIIDDELADILFPDKDGVHRSLINLIKQHEDWNETKFLQFIAKGPSLQLLERCTALIFGEVVERNNCIDLEMSLLPKSFLRLLSWLVTYCDRATLEAVIDFPSVANDKKLSRKAKCIIMLRALPYVQKLTEEETSSYNLGVYLANYLFEEAEETYSSELEALDIPKYVSDWIAFSQQRFENRKPDLSSMTPERKTLYANLFREYWLDKEHELILQQMYSDELLIAYKENSQEESERENLLRECLSIQAYGAYCTFYQRTQISDTFDLDDKFLDNYVEALIQMQKFNKLTDFLLMHSRLDEEKKKRYLIKTVYGIFNAFHYSQKSFSFFNKPFTVEALTDFFQKQMTTNNFPVITVLIALYIHQDEFFKARYLYDIFHSRAEIGNTRIYLQFRKLIVNKTNNIIQVNGEDNHYNVIQTAFYVLAPQKLREFLLWASEIKIPDMANYNPQHVHIMAIKNFLRNPNNTTYWARFLEGLSTRLTQYPTNAWLVCVCDGILSSVWNLAHNFDVRRAYELVLTQMQDPDVHSRYFPIALMPYISAYIIRKDDEQLCRSLRAVVGDGQIWNRISVHNPWAKDYRNSLSDFSDYCARKMKETRNEVYSDLLKVTSPSVSFDNLLAIASVSGNTDYLIRQICNNYLEGKQLGETQSLVEQIDRAGLSFRDTEAIELLQMMYTDESELIEKYPEIWENEEDVYNFKQDCVRILKYYPSIEGLLAFEESCIDTRYKRLIYSYVFGVFYSQELYSKYSIDYGAFKHRTDQIVIAKFLQKVYYAQLVYNTAFNFFYIRWRYLKLYIALTIEAEGPADDTEIINVMKSHHHDDDILDKFFIPFKQAVDSYYELSSINIEEKKTFLYCMMLGKFSKYLEEYSETLKELTEEETIPMKQIVSLLDYRDVSYALYQFYDSEIRTGSFQRAKQASAALVPAAFDVICELETFRNVPDVYNLFQSVLSAKPSECVNAIICLDDSQYKLYHTLIDPLVCSRQLYFQIYKRFRSLALDKNNSSSFERYVSLSRYLGEKIDSNAPAVFQYLEALKAGNDGNREKTQMLLRKIGDEFKQIPASWVEETNKLYMYAAGELDEFHANRNLLDASIGTRTNNSYQFCLMLLDRLAPDQSAKKLTSDETLAAWRNFRDESGSATELERVISGAQVLKNHKIFIESTKGLGISETIDNLALDLGLYVLNAKGNLSINSDNRLEIVAELAEHDLDGEAVFPQFDKLLRYSTCSIDSLCRHRKTIRRFVSGTGYILDDSFPLLYTEILEPCANHLEMLADRQYSCEELYLELEKYLNKLSAMQDSTFRRLLHSAIKSRMDAILNSVRLVITIENINNTITDGYLYFSIENTGNQSVSTKDFEIQVQGIQYELEKNFEVLHPSYITGSRARLTAVPDSGLVIQILHSGIVLSRKILQKGDVLFRNISRAEIQEKELYYVHKAVKVFGREKKLIELRELIEEESKALIYGPSRIGKTSILDLVRKELAAKKGNVIAVTFAGEGSTKLGDYKGIPNDASSGEIEEHLLIEPIKKALNEKGKRLQMPPVYTQEIENELLSILDQNKPIPTRYRMLNGCLEKHELELWLILDEFQTIVARWTPEETGAFAEICADMSEDSRIKLIICGSDDLLKHMVIKKNSIWRKLLPPDPYGVQVKALDEKPFKEMIRTEPLRSHRSAEDAGISYSKEAMTALFRYTGGVPLYGKQICNQVLKTLHADGGFEERSIIYSADVAQATLILIHEQNRDMKNSVKDGMNGDIYAIYDAVTNGLDESTDVLFLSYIARYIMNERLIGCPYSAFTQNAKGSFKFKKEGDEPYKILDDSLSIAEARGIIKKVDTRASDPVYTFCTVFYYSAFLGNAIADRHLENKLFVRTDDEIIEDLGASQIVNDYHALSAEERNKALTLIWRGEKDDTIKTSFRNDFFPPQTIIQTNGGDLVSGNKNIHVNVQSIINTLNGIFAADGDSNKILSGLMSLPRLGSYMPQITSGTDNNEVSETRLSRAIEGYVDIMEEGLKASNDQNGTLLTPPWIILKIPEDEYNEFMEKYMIPQCFLESLQFAYQLEELFEAGSLGINSSDIDYSPVSIMYCKLVECMLKEYHTIPYSQAISSVETNMVNIKNRPHKYKWGDIRKLPQYQQQMLTIGSFVFPIVASNSMSPDTVKENIVDLANDTEGTVAEWRQHAQFIYEIKEIRNSSAHGNKDQRITEAQIKNLVRLLIDDGGFLRLIRIVKKPF